MRVKEDVYVKGPALCANPQPCPAVWEKWCRGCNLVYCAAHVEPAQHACRSLATPTPPPAAPAAPKEVNPLACPYCGQSESNRTNGKPLHLVDVDCEACGGHHRICKKECLKRESRVIGAFPKFKTKLKRCPQ